MYCSKCGCQLPDNSAFCAKCGASQSGNGVVDKDSLFGYSVLGFFLPLIGIIIFLIYEKKEPLLAKAVIKGVVIGFITKIALSILVFVIYLAFAAIMLFSI